MQKKIRQAIGWIIIGLLVIVAFVLLLVFQAYMLSSAWNNGISPMFDLPQVDFFAPLRAFWGMAFAVSIWRLIFSDWTKNNRKK